MPNLSENYQLRQCFLQRNQVPTISLMKKTMSPALANIYFESMTPHLKVIAGLEPPLHGGGNDWIVPPAELLKGRVVLKPFHKKFMSQWHWNGVDEVGMKLNQIHRDGMVAKGVHEVLENDLKWPLKVQAAKQHEWVRCSAEENDANTRKLELAVRTFEVMYTTSITKMQDLLFDAAINEIKVLRIRKFQEMQARYEDLLHQQAIKLYRKYTKKLMKTKTKRKNIFIKTLEKARTGFTEKLHDINVEKYAAVEKLRHFLQCQSLACQVYVAMKERQECVKEMDFTNKDHTKQTKKLIDNMKNKDFKILLAQNKEQKRIEFETTWQKKICHVVKTFQMFVSFCLNMFPEHADFFINMEKLMLLQLSKALDDPKADSIIIMDAEAFTTPIPKPHPFYLFCDKGYKPTILQDLCPKHCTSSASQLPVIVINKQCIYSACDNFEQFTDKIKDYVDGRLKEDAHFDDHHDYNLDVPVTYTAFEKLQELKLESSLLQVLQTEIANARQMPIECAGCQIPHCFNCDSSDSLKEISFHSVKELIKQPASSANQPATAFKEITGAAAISCEKEPKWDAYMNYVKSKKCNCAKLAKKHLFENLPIYMRKMSSYEEPELLNYEKCSVAALKTLVKEARGKEQLLDSVGPKMIPSKTREIGTQCSEEFNYLCTCLSDEELLSFLNTVTDMTSENQFKVVGATMSSTYLSMDTESFVTDQARSLRRLIDQSPEIKDIFKRTNCVFD